MTKRQWKSSAKTTQLEQLESRHLLAADIFAAVPVEPDSNLIPKQLSAFEDRLVLRADDGFSGPEPWISDGVRAPEMLKDIRSGQFGGGPRDFVEFGGDLYFAANNGTLGYELYRSNGTESGTEIVVDLWLGAEGGAPTDMTVLGDHLYFFAHNGDNGRELFRTDGTDAGTELIKDGIEGRQSVSGERMTLVGDQLFYLGLTESSGDTFRLWVSDGTEAGTNPLDLDELQFSDGEPVWMTPFGAELIIGSRRGGLWITDGTETGTRSIRTNVDISGMAVAHDRLYLSAQAGLEVFSTDFTTTTKIANASGGVIASGSNVYYWDNSGVFVVPALDSSPTRLVGFVTFFGSKMGTAVAVPGGLIFNVNKALDDYEVWTTDGSVEATVRLDTVSDTSLEPLEGFLQVGEHIYFAATNGATRPSVWQVPAPTYAAPVIEQPGVQPGDVTGDQLVNVNDLDTILAAIASGSEADQFDLDGDQSVTSGDAEYLVQNILQTRSGDLDLDGSVAFADFLVLSTNFGQSDLGWADGDLTGDGTVGFGDFLLMSANFGFSSGA